MLLLRAPSRRITNCGDRELSRVHSAHINQDVEVYYRWHALHGRKVRQLYAERRSGRDVVVVEAEPGAAIVLAAWMLDPAVCATMLLGAPMIDMAGLADLDRLLKVLGLRRPCSDEPLPTEGVHHAIVVASNRSDQAKPSARDIARPSGVERDGARRPQHRDPVFGPPANGSRRHRSRGDQR